MEFASGEKTSAGRRCALCGVQFAGGPPPPPPEAVSGRRAAGHDAGRDVGHEADREAGREAGGIEWLRCPDCGLRFWADPAGGADGRCAVGLVPEDAP